jgi:NAD(P)-dependent dehydrogenase (short-subunit alcohol dehydrogenase family)
LTYRVALVTGANQGMGKHVAKELVSDGVTVFVGARDLERGKKAASDIGEGAIAVHLDVTDAASISAAAEKIRSEAGRLDFLINNAAVSSARTDIQSFEVLRASSTASKVPLEEVRAVWEVNVFGPLAVYQKMLPLLRGSADARIVNVTSAMGSLHIMGDPMSPNHPAYEPVYSASKTALNAITLSMIVELESSGIKVNLVSPGFAKTALVAFQGTETVEEAAREIVRVARLGPDGPTNTFTTWNGINLPW